MKRISDNQRIIAFGLNASEEGLAGAIESLQAIKANRFPPVKAAKRPRKAKEPKPPLTEVAGKKAPRKGKTDDEEPVPVPRKCTQCDWEGEMIAPEPCPKCGEKTEIK